MTNTQAIPTAKRTVGRPKKVVDEGTRKETKKTEAVVEAKVVAPKPKPKLTPEELRLERRKIRGDLGSDRDVMLTPKIPGMVVRWVNDELKSGRNRVERLMSLGWMVYDGESVDVAPPNSATEANISRGNGAMIAVGLDRENKPMHAILMMIPEDIYQMDQELKEEALREKEEEMLAQGDQPGMYGGIRIGNI